MSLLKRADRESRHDPLQETIEFLYGEGDAMIHSLVAELHILSLYTKNTNRRKRALALIKQLEDVKK